MCGKGVWAAALLLEVKSTLWFEHDIDNLDRLIAQNEEEELNEDFIDDLEEQLYHRPLAKEQFHLIPRQPQPRNRKVSIHELVDALQKAMESKRRYIAKNKPVHFKLPEKKIDIGRLISDLYNRITAAFKKTTTKEITFTQLLPAPTKEAKVFTFIPLLHLENERKVDTEQKTHFGEIVIRLLKKKR
jgi:chromatin segregation and condensation protein Rec8/ScpA/Scc1 (kleisin family)